VTSKAHAERQKFCVIATPQSKTKVLDHIVIGENRYFTFADAGLIEEYNSDFLSLKEGKRD
jgi:DNA repair protein RadC